jgi:hypothetical protein
MAEDDQSQHSPSIIKEGGYQGSRDPGQPTQLMQEQLRPAQIRSTDGASPNGAAPTQSHGGNRGE